MKVFSLIFKQFSAQFIGKIITSLSTFLILGMVARNFQEKGTGIFTLALTYIGIFNLLVDFGFNAHLLKKENFDFQKLLGTRIVWAIFLTAIALVTLPFWPFSSLDFSKAVIFGSFGILGSAIFTQPDYAQIINTLRHELKK